MIVQIILCDVQNTTKSYVQPGGQKHQAKMSGDFRSMNAAAAAAAHDDDELVQLSGFENSSQWSIWN